MHRDLVAALGLALALDGEGHVDLELLGTENAHGRGGEEGEHENRLHLDEVVGCDMMLLQ